MKKILSFINKFDVHKISARNLVVENGAAQIDLGI